jgi:curli biogenesis system outer membrane secretion channel CsgG
MSIHKEVSFGVIALLTAGCAVTETSRTVEPRRVDTAHTAARYTGPKHRVVVGKFENKSQYQRGIFSEGKDRLGDQAGEILKNHLSQSGRYIVLDRANMKELANEAKIGGTKQSLIAGRFLVTGDVTEFGRRETGGQAAFGILGQQKTQHAHAKISLSLVDVSTSAVIHSVQGAGIFELKNQDILGFGSTAGYDATLNGKVLNLAVIDAINRLNRDLDEGRVQWK